MTPPKLTPLELRVMEALWSHGRLAIREIQEQAFPDQSAYTTAQTTVYRLEEKGAVRRVRKIGNAHVFEALVTREQVRGRLIDDFLGLFGGRSQPLMAHLAGSGKLTLDDVHEAEKLVKDHLRKERAGRK